MTSKVLFGFGALKRMPRLLDQYGARRIFLVTGRTSFEACGAATVLAPMLRNRTVQRYCGFAENPRLEDVERGIDAFRSAPPDAVVAVGGGSVLDMAKLVNALAPQEISALDLVQGHAPIQRPGLPLIAIPTTSGSGSEATHFAVVYVGFRKYSVAGPAILPRAAIVDPVLTFTLDPFTTAVTGMDAFSQAVESYWSVHSTEESKILARRAIALVLRHLSDAVQAPTPDARRGMSKAAHLAGRAINITKTTGAHALSYPLTSYFGIPHGQAVGLTLGRWLLFNSEVSDRDVVDRRGTGYVKQVIEDLMQMMGCADPRECCRRIEDLMRTVGLQTRLSSLGVSASAAVEIVVQNVNAERVVNNPRAATEAALRELVEAVC